MLDIVRRVTASAGDPPDPDQERDRSDARSILWQEVLEQCQRIWLPKLGRLVRDPDARHDIFASLMQSLPEKTLATFLSGPPGFWTRIRVRINSKAIDYCRAHPENLARRGENYEWVRFEPEEAIDSAAINSTDHALMVINDLCRRMNDPVAVMAYYLHKVEGQTWDEIAQNLGSPSGPAIRQRVTRALDKADPQNELQPRRRRSVAIQFVGNYGSDDDEE